jgi:ABC-2 type transport system ATP-binding protein
VSIHVRTDQLSKCFYRLTSRKTALGVIKALARRESLRREHWVLRNVTLQIERGENVAVVGRNGSGKTTLLRILAGIYQKTSGGLFVAGRPRALFSCSAGLTNDLSVVDNIYLFGALHGMSRKMLQPLERRILERTELSHLAHNDLKDLSLGQAQRLALAVFAETPSDFLILDEVIRNVDLGFKLEFESYLAALADSEKTLIMTSHDASVLRRLCQRALWLEAGRLRRFGPVDEVIDEYEDSFQAGVTTRATPVEAPV